MSAGDLTLHRRAMAEAPVLSREAQGALFRRLRVERDAFESASLEAPEIARALLQRWQRLREAARSTGVLSVHHAEGSERDLSAQVDEALGRAAQLFARGGRAGVHPTAARRRIARVLRGAELAVEGIVQAFRESAAGSPERAAAAASLADHDETRDTLVRHDLRLVIRFARPFRPVPVSFADLVQEGCIDLMRAVEKLEPERGSSFSTYAAWWIHQALIRAVQKESRTVRIPSNVYQAQIRYRRAEEALRAATPGEPTRGDLAERLGSAPDEVDRIAASAARIISADALLAGSDDLGIEWILADEAFVDPAAIHDQRVLTSSLPAMLATLGERERALLVARFGLDGREGATLSEVGARFGLSRERVRQIEARALARMRVGPVARSLATGRPAATATV